MRTPQLAILVLYTAYNVYDDKLISIRVFVYIYANHM